MPVTAALFGAGLGFGVRLWANACAKARLMSRPWEHVFLACVGGFVGYNYASYEQSLVDQLNVMRASRGLPALRVRGDTMQEGDSNQAKYTVGLSGISMADQVGGTSERELERAKAREALRKAEIKLGIESE